ncbi:MAG: response regulator [Deltaproteobacteria bacterium]|mgnify:CR=1 FL=1|jgi:DNA-binding response OmpR family regulator|nr:response regulator [Deltaproteobacteria bacterium]MBT4265319.1 response regulator [Deltaproteobacteria bacterium]MBT4643979.1 response regulator [Deltaproteobacteria bacterium]MBT6613097.1 response regulator [Deltaproteobacteria bacterium]
MTNHRILLVDDESEFVDTLAERLYLRGYHAETVNDGEAALRSIGDNCPDLVVLDLKMPGLGGMEVLREIKRFNNLMPVILLTGHGSTKEGIEGMRQGAYDYLIKPINIDELIQKINEAIEGK